MTSVVAVLEQVCYEDGLNAMILFEMKRRSPVWQKWGVWLLRGMRGVLTAD